MLKPFIYGIAFDDGLLAPSTISLDAPRRFNSYMPENFDRRYRDEVRIADALRHSLNVAAVEALDAVGAARFESALRASGARPRRAKAAARAPGRALALGGVGLTLRDTAKLYAGLANGGAVGPLMWRLNAPRGGAAPGEAVAVGRARLMTSASARRITAILRAAPSLAGRAPAAHATKAPDNAKNTRTTNGRRDAWAVGYTDDYVVAVWVGRADGAPRPGATGRRDAAPLMFALFDAAPSSASMKPPAAAPPREPAPSGRNAAATAGLGVSPQIVFPADGATLFVDNGTVAGARGFKLSAVGGDALRWYANGVAVDASANGEAFWRPGAAGVYQLTVVDAAGASASAQIRVRKSGAS